MIDRFPHLFSPIKIGKITVKNRIEVAPMVPCFDFTGYVSRETVEFYKSFARGGAGIVTVGDSSIDFVYARDHYGQLNLDNDGAIGGLTLIAEAVHRYGAKISIELNHSGAGGVLGLKGTNKKPIAPSSVVFNYGGRKIYSVEMNQDQIDMVIDQYASACERCLKAGFDMVMLHGGHGWLLGQFLSPFWNKRKDGYGGNLENRARFPIEVLTEIRKRVGDRLAIEYRISAEELVPGGMQLEETIEFVKMIQDKIDLVHVSLGTMGVDPKYSLWMHPVYLPHGYILPWTERVKKGVAIPVTCMGSIMDLETAEKVLADGKADIVAMARAFLADPDLVNKSFYGNIDDIRPCVRCMYCVDWRTGSLNAPVRCTVNPVTGREIEYGTIKSAEKKKKVVIVGGGPAGMQAALTLSARGHKVKLYEKEAELGGLLRYAAGPPFKQDLKKFLDWLIRQVRMSDIEVKLSTRATIDLIKEDKPDVVIIATGANPIIPRVQGVNKPNVVLAGDVDIGKINTGATVVIVGAGLVGCETALHLARQGKKVTVIDMISEEDILGDAGFQVRACLLNQLHEYSVKIMTGTKLEGIEDDGVRVIDKSWNRYEIPAQTVVLAMGFQADTGVLQPFQTAAPRVFFIGDCVNPGNLTGAIHSAFNTAVEI